MIKILLVDDDQEKRRVITEVALSVEGVDHDLIKIATDVLEAKRAIRKHRFDLVILDMNLPERQECRPKVGAGLGVLQFIKNNAQAKAPGFVVGITAYDDGEEAAAKEFSSPIWKLIRFDHNDESWKEPLREALKYLIVSNRPPYQNDGTSYHIDLGVFVALKEEADSILQIDANWQAVAVPYDSTMYYRGTFSSNGRSVDVVVAQAPRMGMPTAAVIASKLIHTFRPRVLAISGICAGVRGKVELGDVLVADPCFDWGSGKWIRNRKDGSLQFTPAHYQWRLDESIRSSIQRLGSSAQLLSEIHMEFSGVKPQHPPTIHVEAMASGASVLQAAELMSDVRNQHKNLVGIEMESYAVFTAVELASEPKPKCVSIKSVCDFGDETKSDDSHSYAAFTSARFLYALALDSFGQEVLSGGGLEGIETATRE